MSEDNYEDELEPSLPSGPRTPMAARFRGYLPVVVDVETGGFNCATDALLEIAATTIASMAVGLAVSAWIDNADRGMPLLVLLAMLQFILSSALLQIQDSPVLAQLSWLVPARWGFALGAADRFELTALLAAPLVSAVQMSVAVGGIGNYWAVLTRPFAIRAIARLPSPRPSPATARASAASTPRSTRRSTS